MSKSNDDNQKPGYVFPDFYSSPNGSSILEDFLPCLCGKYHLCLLSGEPYVGKTRFVLQMAHCLAQGKEFFWSPALEPQKILYFTERSNESVRRDARDRGLDMRNITVVSILDLNEVEYAEFDANRYKWLKKILKKYPDHDIVILDTFGHFIPTYASGKGGMNDYATMARATRELQRLCLQWKKTMFLVHHYAKERENQGYKTFKAKSSGTNSIAGNTLALWGLEAAGPVDEQSGHSDYLMLSVLYHHAALVEPLYFKSTEEGLLVPVSHSQVIDAMMPKKVPDRHEQVLSLFPDNQPILRSSFIETMKKKLLISSASCYRILGKMQEDGLIAMEKSAGDDIEIRLATKQ